MIQLRLYQFRITLEGCTTLEAYNLQTHEVRDYALMTPGCTEVTECATGRVVWRLEEEAVLGMDI